MKFFRELLIDLYVFVKRLFYFGVFDDHYVVSLLGILIKVRIVHKEQFELKVEDYGLNTNSRDVKIIASLTTFPDRINSVSKTIKTLLNQTTKPDKLILWLADTQFPNKEADLPAELLNLQKYGLTISWCKDLRSYKKIIPTLKEYPNDIIITFDDDIYYEDNVIESLYDEYKKDNSNIYINRFTRIKLKKSKIVKYNIAYEYWWNYTDATYRNLLIGCGGVLYPPKSLNSEVMNEDAFMKILPTQDDVWLWAMAVLNKTKIKVVLSYKMNIRNVENTQKSGLCKINKKGKCGISSLDGVNKIIKYYPEVLKNLEEEVV